MNGITLTTLILLAHSTVFSVDLTTQKQIHESENFIFYAEDTDDYTELIELVERKNKDFETIFKKKIQEKIQIYIFKDQKSFSKHVFNSDTPVQNATGFADQVSMKFYITSFYDTCKSKERLLQTPIHELVHLYYPSEYIWIREGMACYYAEMLTEISPEELPNNFSEIHFYSRGVSETAKAYNCSGWIVKYIIEELLDDDIVKFKSFESNPKDYSFLGFNNETAFFNSWKEYMASIK